MVQLPYPLLLLGAVIWCSIVIFILLFIGYVSYQHWKYSHIPSPPRGSFLWGNMQQISTAMQNGKSLHSDILLKWASDYGPIFKFFTLHKATVVVLEPEVLQDLLTGEHPKPSNYQALCSLFGQRLLGQSIMTEVDNEKIAKRRSILTSALRDDLLWDKLDACCNSFNEKLKTFADGETIVKMFDEFGYVVLDITIQVLCSMDNNSDINRDLYEDLQLIYKSIDHSHNNPMIKYNPMKRIYREEVREAIKHVRGMFRQCVNQRQTALENSDRQQLPHDVLTHWLKTSAVHDTEELVDDLVALLVAGVDTTASMLSFCLFQLCMNPLVYKKVYAEVKAVKEEAKLIKLPYLENVLKETLRLYPVGMGTMRELKTSRIYNNMKIPAASTVLVSMVVMGRVEWYYDKPLVFNPDRFQSSQNM
ncbi:cholesterol 24-hydroxylase-like [Saccoglossus kowalevskii]